jgi:hypothetical protein
MSENIDKEHEEEMQKIDKQHEEEMRKINRRMSEENRLGDLNRARSITVGTAFGGTTEIGMRCNDGRFVWSLMQPVEVIELIHQLAANIGCHLQLVPRKDFGSWRDWKYTDAELAHYRGVQFLPGVGHPPHSNDMAPHMLVGANLPHPEQQSGMPLKEELDDETMAIEAPKQRRRAKRATKTS